MKQQLNLGCFLERSGVLLDVRSPSEFAHAHIPGAVNLPILNDAERVQVGTTYKQQGQNAAVQLGVQLVIPRLIEIKKNAQRYTQGAPAKICCWRGGMRSEAMSNLLSSLGIPTMILSGGYKAYRRSTLNLLSQSFQIAVIGGMTGCGKTDLLDALRDQGEQVLDLEALASHRGSSFGMLGMPEQPSCEQFENLIAEQLGSFQSDRLVWIEDESRMVGRCKVPDDLFAAMQQAPLYLIERPFSARFPVINEGYGCYPAEALIGATQRIKKRLGGQRTQMAIESIKAGDYETAVQIILGYYDRAYTNGLEKRHGSVVPISAGHLSSYEVTSLLLKDVALVI